MRRLLLLAAAVFLSSCAAMRRSEGRIDPGDRVSAEEASDYCRGDLERYESELADAQQRRAQSDATVVPDVGDDLCTVVAKVGEPDERAAIQCERLGLRVARLVRQLKGQD